MPTKTLLAPAVLGLALALTACSGGAGDTAAAPAASSASATGDSGLDGVWQMTELTADGTPVPYAGQITFTADTVAVQASNPNTTAPDTAYTVQGYEAFYGDLTVDEDAGTFSVDVQSAVARDLVGQTLTRVFDLDGDQLVLTPADAAEGWQVTYERVAG